MNPEFFSPNEQENKLGKYFYFSLEFSYPGPFSNFGCSESSAALNKACEEIEKLSELGGLQVRTAYCWPDGSLSYLARSERELNRDALNSTIFINEVKVGSIYPTNPRFIRSTPPITHEEKFEIEHPELLKLINARYDELEVFMRPYRKARDECDKCKPGNGGCGRCRNVLLQCYKTRYDWHKTPRVLNKEDINAQEPS